MHFGFTLDLSDIDLLNVDLLDERYTHLDLFVSQTSWRRLQDMSSRRLQDMSSRRLQNMSSRRHQRNNFSSSKTSSRRFPRCLQDVLKTSSRHLCKKSPRRLGRRKIVTLKTCWRRLQDVLKTNKCLLDYLFNNDSSKPASSKSTSFMLNVAFDFVLNTVYVK